MLGTLSRYYNYLPVLGSRQWWLFFSLLLAIIAYIIICYHSWQQKQLKSYITNNPNFLKANIEGFKSSNIKSNNTTDGLQNNICSATPIRVKLTQTQIMQPNSKNAIKLANRIQKEYTVLMDSRNLAARGFNNGDINQFMTNFCIPISNEDFERVRKMLDGPRIAPYKNAWPLQNYLNYWVPKIQLAKSRPHLEHNMPHTHGNTMLMPDGWWENPDYTIFMHELTHIHQRAHPYEWEALYEDAWNFIYVPDLATKVRGLDAIISRSRLNPDGSDFNWLWLGANDNKARWIGAVYPVIEPRDGYKLTQVEYVCVPLNKEGDTWLLPERYQTATLPRITDDSDFMTFFGTKSNNYHPNELGAQIMEMWLPFGILKHDIPAVIAFDKWIRELPWISD